MSRAEDVIADALAEAGVSHAQLRRHYTTAVIEAIRNLGPDDLAELIGGSVERMTATYPDAHVPKRVVGPWKETP